MRLVSFRDGGRTAPGVLAGDRVVPAASLGVQAASVRELLAELDGPALRALGERAAAAPEGRPLQEVTLAAPVGDPQKIICIGLNYRDHARESGQEIPSAIIWFAKFANSLIGSGADILLPPSNPDAVDYEAELAVVVGRPAHRVSAADALDHLAGAMAFNDVSARDLQFLTSQWNAGKAIDTFAPCGPALVTLDEVGDVQALSVRTRLNGKLVQDGNTADQVFGVAEVVSWLSRSMTLQPGDIIATGTPAGVGAASGSFLRDGDTVEIDIGGVGSISNTVRSV